MLKCIAIDDEPLALRQLQGYIAKINFLKLEKAFTNAIEAQQYLTGNPIDLIFVDINTPSRDSTSMRSTTCSNRSASPISTVR